MSLNPRSNALVEALGRHFFLGRSSSYVPGRHAVLHAAALRAALAKTKVRAERGRLLRLLGDPSARAELDAAARKEGSAAAFAWRWEADDAAGRADAADLDRAIALEPKNGWWRLWRALARAGAGSREAALEEASAAAGLMPADALPHAARGIFLSLLKRHEEAVAALDAALALDPSLEWGWRLRGIAKHDAGDAAGCLADCERAMRLDENSGLLFVMLGIHELKTDPRRSVDAATRRIESNPEDWWAYVFRADNRRTPQIGENLGAVQDLRRAAELAPDRGFVWAYLSRCQVTSGDFKEAGRSLQKAVELEPETGWIRAWQGEFQRRGGDAKTAEKTLDRAIALFPDYELAYAWRGSARRLQGKSKAALADLDVAIALKPHTLDLCLFERMQTHRAMGETAAALADIQAASRLNAKYVWEAEPARFGAGLAELDAELKRDPRSALARLWRGDVLMRLRDFKAAEKELTRALALPDCPHEALVLRGRARSELGRGKSALADLSAAIKKAPGSPDGWAWRGRVKLLAGSAAGALADFDAALERAKNSAWLLCWKGEAEIRLKRWAAAEASLTRAIEVHVKFADAHLWRGVARARRGDREGAHADLARALELKPGDGLASFHRASLLAAQGRPGEARADAERALADPGLLSPAERRALRALLRRKDSRDPATEGIAAARALQKEGRHEEAAELLGRLLARRRRDPDLLEARAEAWRCLARYDLSLADLDAAAALKPGDAAAIARRVEIKRHLGDFAGGLADADAAIALAPASASAWVQRSECLRSLGRYDEAVAAATNAVERDRAWTWALVVRAKARRQGGDVEGAIADTLEAERGGVDAYARGWRAEFLRKAGRLEESLADVERASALQPQNAWFIALRGQILCDLGRREQGLAELQRSLRLDPRLSCDYDFLGAEGPAIRADAALDWVWGLRGACVAAAASSTPRRPTSSARRRCRRPASGSWGGAAN
ncbi:MAG: tetratricopeptide repeat protein [Elusimicrobiota bacterium]|nr:MAG: tetratricopeptide repeat protein [Elusimicrobiota bacterium]